MKANEILQKWAEYSDYDPDKKTFCINIDGSFSSYDLQKMNDNIKEMLEYDPTEKCLY